jgi:hypothetical protein
MARRGKRERRRVGGSQNPLQGHVVNDLRPLTRPHLLHVSQHLRLGPKPLSQGPLEDISHPNNSTATENQIGNSLWAALNAQQALQCYLTLNFIFSNCGIPNIKRWLLAELSSSHLCNCSYSGGEDQEDHSSRAA